MVEVAKAPRAVVADTYALLAVAYGEPSRMASETL